MADIKWSAFTDGGAITSGDEVVGLRSGGNVRLTANQFEGINFGDETLSDYDEGTFTPTFTFGNPGDLSVAYSTQIGTYTRIGNQVTLGCVITFTPTYSTSAGSAVLQGAPFATTGNNKFYSGVLRGCNANMNWGTSNTILSFAISTSSTNIFFQGSQSGAATIALSTVQFASGTEYTVSFSITYTI